MIYSLDNRDNCFNNASLGEFIFQLVLTMDLILTAVCHHENLMPSDGLIACEVAKLMFVFGCFVCLFSKIWALSDLEKFPFYCSV